MCQDIAESEIVSWLQHTIVAQLLQNGPVGVVVLSLPDEQYFYANQTFLNIVGFEWEQLKGRTAIEVGLVEPAENARLRQEITEHGFFKNYEVKIKHKSGRVIYMLVSTEVAQYKAQPCVVILQQDITAHKLAEMQLRESEAKFYQLQKMEIIGKLSGGLAHDFNNMLTVLAGCSSVISRSLPVEHAAQADLLEIQKVVERATRLTHHLLTFSSQQVLQPELVSLNELITEMLATLLRLVGEQVEICANLHASLPAVLMQPSQLEQIILNLVLNAHEAMPQGGTLTLRTYEQEVLLPALPSLPATIPPSGRWVVLEVSDTGHGMDASLLPHIFEPFFTTKAPGTGSGLGLAIVYGIVHQNGGQLAVESTPASGSHFKIYLPAHFANPLKREKKIPMLVKPQRDATILVVEDEEMVRNLTRRILAKSGFRVLEAANSQRALEICRSEKIELMLTDVIMPGMTGNELAALVTQSMPNLKVLFMSGYTAGLLTTQSSTHFIQKPFTPNDLINKINQVLVGVAV